MNFPLDFLYVSFCSSSSLSPQVFIFLCFPFTILKLNSYLSISFLLCSLRYSTTVCLLLYFFFFTYKKTFFHSMYRSSFILFSTYCASTFSSKFYAELKSFCSGRMPSICTLQKSCFINFRINELSMNVKELP
jgi:hypothetical protein